MLKTEKNMLVWLQFILCGVWAKVPWMAVVGYDQQTLKKVCALTMVI